jgi:hypothetical protein
LTVNVEKPVKTNIPLDWLTTGHLSEEVKDLLLEIYTNSDGKHLKAYPAINVNTLSNPMQLGICPSIIVDPLAPTTQANVIANNLVQENHPTNALQVSAGMYVYNAPAFTQEAVRTPTWFFTVNCTTIAATPIVAAVAAKKHRILGIIVNIAGGMAAAGLQTVSILDVAADMGLDPSFWVAIAATPVGQSIYLDLRPNGKLVAAVNTAINVTLTAAMTAGAVSVTIWGDDE